MVLVINVLVIVLILWFVWIISGETTEIVLVADEAQSWVLLEAQKASFLVSGIPSTSGPNISVLIYRENHTQELNTKAGHLLHSGVVVLADVTCSGLPFLRSLSDSHHVVYLHLQTPASLYLTVALNYLSLIKTKEAAFIFQSEREYQEALCYVLDERVDVQLLLLLHDGAERLEKLASLQPRHSNYVVFGSSTFADSLLTLAEDEKLLLGENRWIVFPHDDDCMTFRSNSSRLTVIQVADSSFCAMKGSSECVCREAAVRCHHVQNVADNYYRALISSLRQAVSFIPKSEINIITLLEVYKNLSYPFRIEKKEEILMTTLEFSVFISDQTGLHYTSPFRVGKWTKDFGFQMNERLFNTLKRRKFRIGAIQGLPFLMSTKGGGYEGLCMDILKELQKEMDFEFELVFPEDGRTGTRNRSDDSWNGLVGILSRKEVDIGVGVISVTAERAQVVEFVIPYIDQTGISILGKKPSKPQTIFKFLQVMTPPVWYSIVGAVVTVSVGLWLLEVASPYSARIGSPNSRIFTLKESLWFAMTSFTPQGGGEIPKSLSGRILVTSYWLFVVLILATFSANLAALLTVERMDPLFNSLEQLAKERDFKFTAVAGTTTFEYFTAMAEAEEELYKSWKELTLKKSQEYTKYRVWDYPIREQYQKILEGIRRTGTVASLDEGVRMVRDDPKGRFALLTDVTQVRYLVNQECGFIQIGEVFGEHPYALTVTKGSSLKREISDQLMILQQKRFFEDKLASYLNSTKRRQCEEELDTLGVYDLGGVFVVLGIGAVIALVAVVMDGSRGRSHKSTRRKRTRVRHLQPPQPLGEPDIGQQEQVQVFHIVRQVVEQNQIVLPAQVANEAVLHHQLPPLAVRRHTSRHVCRPEPGCLGLNGRPVHFPTVDW